nr:hypothetical protein [Lebetimonas sp. JH292]
MSIEDWTEVIIDLSAEFFAFVVRLVNLGMATEARRPMRTITKIISINVNALPINYFCVAKFIV